MGKKKKTRKAQKPAPTTPSPDRTSLPGGLSLRYQYLVGVLLLVVSLCVLYPELVFQNKVFHAGDAETAASFATPIQKEMAKTGGYPLWNPYLFSGMPSYSSLTYNPYVYPVNAVTTVLSKYLHFPSSTWLLLHILLLGFGVFLVLMDRGVHFLIAAGAGILMMWMPNHVAVGAHGHGSQASAVAYLPFVLLFWDRLWRGKGVLLNGSVLVVLLGFQLLRAHLQISFYTFALLGLHFVFFGFLKIRDAVRHSGAERGPVFGFLRGMSANSPGRAALADTGALAVVLGIIVVGALLVSAVLFFPVQDYAKYSIRGASESGGLDYDYATSWSLHPAETLTFIVPSAYGFGKSTYFGYMPFTDYPNYVGLLVALVAITALFILKTRFARFLAFVIVVTTLVSFGKHMPLLYKPLFETMPYFNKFRIPVMALIVQQLAFVLLFGLGLSALLRVDPEKGRKHALIAVGVSVLVLLIVIVTAGYWTNGFSQSIASKIRSVRSVRDQIAVAHLAGGFLFKDLVKLSLLLLASSTLLSLYYRRVLAATPFVIAILGLAIIDVYMVDRYIVHPEKFLRNQRSIISEKATRDRFLQSDDVMSFLQQDEQLFRIFPIFHPSIRLSDDYRGFRSNRYMNFGIASVGGYHTARLGIYEEFLQALDAAVKRNNFQLLNMLNVRYFVTSNAFPENPLLRPVFRGKDYAGEEKIIYENLRALPRAFFVDQYQVVPGSRPLELLAGGQVADVGEVVLLEERPSIEPVSDEGAEAVITDYGFSEIHIDVKLPAAAILVLGDTYYPRWRVYVDGEKKDVLRANYILRAVALPAGEHEVVFRYDTSLVKKSLAISVTIFSIALILIVTTGLLSFRGRMLWNPSS